MKIHFLTFCALFILSAVSALAQPKPAESFDDILKGYKLETIYETKFDKPIRMIREDELIENGKRARKPPKDIDWVLEGPAEITVKQGRMHMKNDPSGNCVLWNTRTFPDTETPR